MARYEVRLRPSVAKDLRAIPRADVERILARIGALGDDPRPPGCEKLSGQEHYRLRQGSYRIVYAVFDTDVIVEVVKVAHRRDIYRRP